LEFHCAGWGWSGGDPSGVTLPGGTRINYYSASLNYALIPGHPLLNGVPSPFSGTGASHAFLTAIPGGATLVASDDVGRPDLAVYPHGAGQVVAGCQTFEYGYTYNQDAGRVLANMVPFTHDLQSNWLHVDPTS